MRIGRNKEGDLSFSAHPMEIATVILGVLAIGLGVLVFGKFSASSPKKDVKVTPSPTQAVKGFVLPQEFLASEYYKLLSQDEKQVLKVPARDAAENGKQAHYAAAIRAAKDGNTLEIGKCEVSPVVLRTKEGSTITLKNSDDKPHTIAMDATHIYPVAANGEATIKALFDKGPGLYGFGCDKNPYTQGFFVIAK